VPYYLWATYRFPAVLCSRVSFRLSVRQVVSPVIIGGSALFLLSTKPYLGAQIGLNTFPNTISDPSTWNGGRQVVQGNSQQQGASSEEELIPVASWFAQGQFNEIPHQPTNGRMIGELQANINAIRSLVTNAPQWDSRGHAVQPPINQSIRERKMRLHEVLN